MAFVYRNHGDFHRTQLGAEYFRIQPFRRNIKEFVIAEDAVFECGKYFLPPHARIDGKSFDFPLPQILHLIFHQGDKRGDDDTNALLGESGHLKCNRLTASGRHQSQCVFAFADTGDDLLLQVAEGVITPVLF